MYRLFSAAIVCLISFNWQASAQQLFSNQHGTGEDRCREVSAEKLRNDPSYAREMAWDRMMFGDIIHPCGVQLEPFDPGTWERTPPLKASDSQGREASFRLYVLDERFSWVLGSSSGLETTTDGETKFRDIFARPLFLNEFCSADSVVSIGTASHEGATDYNLRLAGNRARTVANELENVGKLCESSASPPLYELNLGKHRDISGCTTNSKCASSSSPQRRLVIVAAEKAAPGANLNEALKATLEKTRIINAFSIADYHEFLVRRRGPGRT